VDYPPQARTTRLITRAPSRPTFRSSFSRAVPVRPRTTSHPAPARASLTTPRRVRTRPLSYASDISALAVTPTPAPLKRHLCARAPRAALHPPGRQPQARASRDLAKPLRQRPHPQSREPPSTSPRASRPLLRPSRRLRPASSPQADASLSDSATLAIPAHATDRRAPEPALPTTLPAATRRSTAQGLTTTRPDRTLLASPPRTCERHRVPGPPTPRRQRTEPRRLPADPAPSQRGPADNAQPFEPADVLPNRQLAPPRHSARLATTLPGASRRASSQPTTLRSARLP
jgi:hypothetical protein